MAPALPARDARGCVRIGPLQDFVRRLDEGADVRSLHDLAGQLHMAAGDAEARLRWVAAIRERFAAAQAASFECEPAGVGEDVILASPPGRTTYWLALGAIKATLMDVAVGEAVTYRAGAAASSPQDRMTVMAAAVKCSPARAVGFVLVCGADSVANPDAVEQYLAAVAWHLRCAEAASAKVRALEQRLSPLDLLDVLPLPALVTDGAGRAIERNPAFTEFMDAAALRLSTGRLRFDDPFLQDSWLVALAEVEVTAVRQSILVPAPDGSHWRVHLVPLRCAIDVDDPMERQLIVAMVERQAQLAGSPLDNMVGDASRPLTPAESEVLDAVLQGHSAKVIATARNASVNTVRSQIMAILEKTGHHNQKSLIAAFAPSGFRSSIISSIGTPVPATGRRIPKR